MTDKPIKKWHGGPTGAAPKPDWWDDEYAEPPEPKRTLENILENQDELADRFENALPSEPDEHDESATDRNAILALQEACDDSMHNSFNGMNEWEDALNDVFRVFLSSVESGRVSISDECVAVVVRLAHAYLLEGERVAEAREEGSKLYLRILRSTHPSPDVVEVIDRLEREIDEADPT